MRGEELGSLVKVVKMCDDFVLGGIGIIECDGLVGGVMIGIDVFHCFHALTLILTMNSFCLGPPFLIMTCLLNFEN